MDYAELFERQGRLVDDLLVDAFQVPQDGFTAAAPEGAPSLRDLLVEWLETQRRVVHGAILGRPYIPLPASATARVTDLAQAFGGFRLTLRDTLEATFRDDLTRRVTWTGADGAVREVTLDEALAHLVLHGARMTGLVAQRLRQLGRSPPRTDLLG
jgi:uncharacterized damage-inducible protein DinB